MAGLSGSVTSAAGGGGYKIKIDWSTTVINANANPPTAETTTSLYVISPSNNYFINWTITSSLKVGSVTIASDSKQYSSAYNAVTLLCENVGRSTTYTSSSGGTYTKSWTLDAIADGSGTSTVAPQNMSLSTTVSFPDIYTYFFDANGGSVGTSSLRAGSGDSITLPTPSRSNYNFNGWYDGGTYIGGAGTSVSVTSTRSLTASWTIATPAPTWTDNSITSTARVGSYYSSSISATSSPEYSFSGLPSGISQSGTSGSISGYPTTAGTYNVSFSATNAGGSISGSGSIVVSNRLPSWSDNTVSTAMRQGVSYSDGVSANYTSYYTSSGSLPAGLSFNTSNGTFSGTPTTPGTYTFAFQAFNVDNEGIGTSNFTATVKYPLVTWNDSSISTVFSVGTPYSDSISANNAFGYAVYSGSLPDGVTLNTATGVISGTPTTGGTYTFTLAAYNGSSEYSYISPFTVTVADPGGKIFVFNGSSWVEREPYYYNGNWNSRAQAYYYNGSTWERSQQ